MAAEASVAWIIVGGTHESPATAGDAEVHELIREFTAECPSERRRAVWLGEVPAKLGTHLGEVMAVSTADFGQRALELRPWLAGREIVRLLLCAPLRHHAESWWASGVLGNELLLFDVVALSKTLLSSASSCELLVPGARSWNTSSGTAVVDIPDRSTLDDWQEKLKAVRLSCSCHLVWAAKPGTSSEQGRQRYLQELSRPPPVAFEKGLPRALDEDVSGWEGPLLLWRAQEDPELWGQRLSAYLGACGVQAVVGDVDEPAPSHPALSCALHESALESPRLRARLEALGADGGRLVLLDRFLNPGCDALGRWRCPPSQRGPWRALDQALWLANEMLPKGQPLPVVEFESIRSRILACCDELRDSAQGWERALGDDWAWLADAKGDRHVRLLSSDRNGLESFIASVLSLLGSSPKLCLDDTSRPIKPRPALERLIQLWLSLRTVDHLDADDRRVEPARVRCTCDDTFDWPSDDDPFVNQPGPEPSKPEPITKPNPFELEQYAFWVHVGNKRPPPEMKQAFRVARLAGTVVVEGLVVRANGKGIRHPTDCIVAPDPSSLIKKVHARFSAEWKAQRLLISYSARDCEPVEGIVRELEQRGIRCTLDGRKAHVGRLPEAIDGAIVQHQALLLVHSDHALASDLVRAELRAAVQRLAGKPPIIVLDLDGSWQRSRAEYGLAKVEAIRFSWKGGSGVRGVVDELLRGLRAANMKPGRPRKGAEDFPVATLPVYPPHRVFVSHSTKKPRHQRFVARLVELSKSRGITCWEYSHARKPGADWKKELKRELKKATHAVVLITNEFERSRWGQHEVRVLMEREPPVTVLPFLLEGRSSPHVDLAHLQHYSLSVEGSDESKPAETILDFLHEALVPERSPP